MTPASKEVERGSTSTTPVADPRRGTDGAPWVLRLLQPRTVRPAVAIGAVVALVGCERPPPDIPASEQCRDDASVGVVSLYERFDALADEAPDSEFAARVLILCDSGHTGYLNIGVPELLEGATAISLGASGACPFPRDLGVASLGEEIVMEFDWTCSDDGEVFEEGRIRATLPQGALLEIGDTAPMELEEINLEGR